MNKINWINFLHIYQPPWQQKTVTEQIASESYQYLLELFEKYPHWRASLNISGSLLEQLSEVRLDLLKKLQTLVRSGQIELTGSAKYHALLPLVDKEEIVRQIELNNETLSYYFDIKKIKGFYLPEMAYSFEVAKVIKKMGYQWIILDEIAHEGKVDNKILYQLKGLGIKVIFRNRKISKAYPAEVIYNKLKNLKENQIIVTGTDGEMYGHQHEDWQGHLEKVLKSKQVYSQTVSEYLADLKTKEKVSLRNCSWESTPAELKKGMPYALWSDPKNPIHHLLWELVDLASHLVKKYKKDKNWYWARNHLDKGLASCTFWWASATKLSSFSPVTWNPDMIDNGAEELVRSIRSLEQATVKEKVKAENIYINIKKTTWLTHWRRHNKKTS